MEEDKGASTGRGRQRPDHHGLLCVVKAAKEDAEFVLNLHIELWEEVVPVKRVKVWELFCFILFCFLSEPDVVHQKARAELHTREVRSDS